VVYTTGVIPQLNAWSHIACSHDGTTLTIYLNGVSIYSVATAITDNASPVYIGSDNNTGNYFAGNISDLRVVKGTSVYTTAFTPPTAPLTVITNTSLLIKNVNASCVDYTSNVDVATLGNAQVNTTTVKYDKSFYFDGTGDYLVMPAGSSNQLGSGDFTIECWFNLTARLNPYSAIFSNYNSFAAGALGFFYGHLSSTTAKYQLAVNGVFPAILSTSNITYATWNHLAVVRSGTTITLYINGVSEGTYTSSATLNGVGPSFYIGTTGDAIASGYINGYIEDFRISKVARYTSAFTPPTTKFLTG
jgi:hypothetical protein